MGHTEESDKNEIPSGHHVLRGTSSTGTVIGAIGLLILIAGVGSATIYASRNTIIWLFIRFYGETANVAQSGWDQVLSLFGHHVGYVNVFGTFSLTFGLYWFVSGLWTYVDITGKPLWIAKYKIQDKLPYPVNNPVGLWVTAKQVLYNQICIGLPYNVFMAGIFQFRGCPTLEELPSIHQIVMEFVVFIIVEEILFYYFHRMLHHPLVYKYVHKRHHEYQAPISMATMYCHPIEHLLSNLIPVSIGPLIMGSHTFTQWLWFTLATINSLNSHSGIHLPLMPSPEAHDYHHLKFTQNYGVLGVLDRLHGTDDQFRKSPAFERHIMLLSTIPVNIQFPGKN